MFKKFIFMSLAGLFSLQVGAGPIMQAVPLSGGTPLALTLIWQCPATTTKAAATSTGNQAVWTGDKPVKGSQNITGAGAPASYMIECSSIDTTATTVTVIPPAPNADGTTLPSVGLHLYWDTVQPMPGGKWANTVTYTGPMPLTGFDVPVPNLPTGTVYFAADLYIAQGGKSDLSSVISKQITKGVLVSDKIQIVLPGAPTITVK